jgi:hypothetical protein
MYGGVITIGGAFTDHPKEDNTKRPDITFFGIGLIINNLW